MYPTVLITVDTEALPARASENHVERLVWGRHLQGTAGIAEICDAVEDCGGIALFFLEVAGSVDKLAAYREINSYLTRRGHLVEWHYHPEILGRKFWQERGASGVTMRQDLFDASDAEIVLDFGLRQFKRITGKMPLAYRAGSFRWNQSTIEFLARCKIPYSFNACAETGSRENFATYQPKSPHPFVWPSGVIEVPCGEVLLEGGNTHFRFPRKFTPELTPETLAEQISGQASGLVQILLHSWSFLDRTEDGLYFYKDNRRVNSFHKILKRLTRKYQLPESVDNFYDSICQRTSNIVSSNVMEKVN